MQAATLQRAILALVHLREDTTYAKLAAGFRISEGTAYAYVQSVIGHLASRAPSLTQARPEYVFGGRHDRRVRPGRRS